MKRLLIFIKIQLIILLLIGCSKDILQETPPHLLSSETLFNDLNGFEAGLNGLYNLARYAAWDREIFENVLNGVDNMASNYDRGQVYFNWGPTNSPASSDLKKVWEWLYETINAANTIISRAENENIDWHGGGVAPEENKNRIIAEARAIRGWCYRRLAYSWGDVPLNLSESLGSSIRTDWERTPRAEVRRQVISDLHFAQKHVPVEGSLQGRLTKGAVQTFLADMYLAINKPDSALYWANQVIDEPAYYLVTERYGVRLDDPEGNAFGDMFKEGNQNREQGNTEALWVWQFELYSVDGQGSRLSRSHTGNYNVWVIDGVRALQYTYERGGRGKSYFAPTKWWIESYEPQDVRASNYILRKFFILNDASVQNPPDILPPGYNYGDTIWLNWEQDLSRDYRDRPDWPYSRKAEGTDPNNARSGWCWHDQIYLRLADTYLLKAEAQYKLGHPEQAAATINIIRERSNATPVTGADIDIDFILDERSRELFLEEDRRFTLLRTGKWLERTALYNNHGGELVSGRDTLFAFPQSVIDANLTAPMPPNPGWD